MTGRSAAHQQRLLAAELPAQARKLIFDNLVVW
jgi:hypothetical protein